MPMDFCKGIYAGCCIIADSRCEPCERIASGKSTVEKEMAIKAKLEKPLMRKRHKRRRRA